MNTVNRIYDELASGVRALKSAAAHCKACKGTRWISGAPCVYCATPQPAGDVVECVALAIYAHEHQNTSVLLWDSEPADIKDYWRGHAEAAVNAASGLLASPKADHAPAVPDTEAGWMRTENSIAPEDGTPILVFGGRHDKVSLVPADGYFWNLERHRGSSAVPTHWRPLPAPPASIGEK